MKSKKKFKAIMGVSLAVMLAVPVSVFGISGAFGSSPKAQQSQTTASPLGLNPETDPVIMTTDYGLEIKLGGAAFQNPFINKNKSEPYAYFTTSGTAGTVNWVIIGSYGVTSGTVPSLVSENLPPIISADKNTKIDDPSYTKESVETQSGALSSSPLYDPNDPIMSELLATDPVTWYKINYTKEVAGTKTLSSFPNAKSNSEIGSGNVLCISENILFKERFENGDSSYYSEYGTTYDLCKAMNAIASSGSYTNYDGTSRSCNYGLGSLGLYSSSNTSGKIRPQTLKTADYYHGGAGGTSASLVSLQNQYLFPLASAYYSSIHLGETANYTQYAKYQQQNFLFESYFDYTGYSGETWTSGKYYFLNAKVGQKPAENQNYSATYWWLRSGYYYNSNCACCVDYDGALGYGSVGATTNVGVRPAFVLKI